MVFCPAVEIRFTWAARKAAQNEAKHGVSFHEAVSVFGDPLARIHDDPGHSRSERREIVVGRSRQGRLLLVSFTERKQTTRLISARKATRHERKDYEGKERS